MTVSSVAARLAHASPTLRDRGAMAIGARASSRRGQQAESVSVRPTGRARSARRSHRTRPSNHEPAATTTAAPVPATQTSTGAETSRPTQAVAPSTTTAPAASSTSCVGVHAGAAQRGDQRRAGGRPEAPPGARWRRAGTPTPRRRPRRRGPACRRLPGRRPSRRRRLRARRGRRSPSATASSDSAATRSPGGRARRPEHAGRRGEPDQHRVRPPTPIRAQAMARNVTAATSRQRAPRPSRIVGTDAVRRPRLGEGVTGARVGRHRRRRGSGLRWRADGRPGRRRTRGCGTAHGPADRVSGSAQPGHCSGIGGSAARQSGHRVGSA